MSRKDHRKEAPPSGKENEQTEGPSNETNSWRKETEKKVMRATPKLLMQVDTNRNQGKPRAEEKLARCE
jgi:hypothetical protein